MDRSNWISRYILAAVLIQLAGYAALSTLVPQSDFAVAVDPLQRIPVFFLISVAVLAVPAVVLAVSLGAILSTVGLQPTTALVPVSVYIISVLSQWVYRRVSRYEHSTKSSPPY